jgi:hypothetical protein
VFWRALIVAPSAKICTAPALPFGQTGMRKIRLSPVLKTHVAAARRRE